MLPPILFPLPPIHPSRFIMKMILFYPNMLIFSLSSCPSILLGMNGNLQSDILKSFVLTFSYSILLKKKATLRFFYLRKSCLFFFFFLRTQYNNGFIWLYETIINEEYFWRLQTVETMEGSFVKPSSQVPGPMLCSL